MNEANAIRIAGGLVATELMILWGTGLLGWVLSLLLAFAMIVIWDWAEPEERFRNRCERQ